MKYTSRALVRLMLLALLIAAPLAAQSQPQSQQPPKQPAQPGQQTPPGKAPAQPGQPAEPAKPAVNPEEEAAYKAFFDLKGDPALQIKQGEEFLQKYAESRYREAVLTKLMHAYQIANDPPKMFGSGEKALALNPDNLDVLTLMGWALARSVNMRDLDAPQKIERAEKYTRHALELLNTVPKPEQMTEEDFAKAKNDALSMAHSGLGLVLFRKQRPADAIPEFEQATKLAASPDPIDYYLLGIVLSQTKRHADAASAFERCAALPSSFQDTCKQGQAEAKKLAAAQPAPAPAPAPQPPKP